MGGLSRTHQQVVERRRDTFLSASLQTHTDRRERRLTRAGTAGSCLTSHAESWVLGAHNPGHGEPSQPAVHSPRAQGAGEQSPPDLLCTLTVHRTLVHKEPSRPAVHTPREQDWCTESRPDLLVHTPGS